MCCNYSCNELFWVNSVMRQTFPTDLIIQITGVLIKYTVNIKLYEPFWPCMVFHANFGVLMILKCKNMMLSVASSWHYDYNWKLSCACVSRRLSLVFAKNTKYTNSHIAIPFNKKLGFNNFWCRTCPDVSKRLDETIRMILFQNCMWIGKNAHRIQKDWLTTENSQVMLMAECHLGQRLFTSDKACI